MTTFDERYSKLPAEARTLLDGWLAAESALVAPLSKAPAPPATATERALAEIWQEVLDLETVGREDDYFAVGGDSIRAIVVIAKANAAGISITTQDLFQERTIARLAVLVDAAPEGGCGSLPCLPIEGAPATGRDERSRALSPMQEGILYHCLGAGRPVYVVQVVCDLIGELDVAALHRAWDAVINQHEGLRTSFHYSGQGAPRQAAQAASMPAPSLEDWRHLDDRRRDDRLREYLAADLARGFDLSHAPLVRLALFRITPTLHRCLLTHHHLLLDGWSLQIVLVDVLEAYGRVRAGRPAMVPVRPSVFDLAELPATSREGSMIFWRDYLKGFRRPVPLPRTGAGAAAAMTGTFELPCPAAEELYDFCRRHGISPATVVHAGWATVLAHLTGADDVVFGMTVSGRSAVVGGLPDAIGMFINTVPVRVRLPDDASLVSWLGHLHDGQVAILQHERTPLTEIARVSEVPSGAGLFESIVVVENLPDRRAEFVGDDATGGLRVDGVRTYVDEGYPIVVEVSPGSSIFVRARYDLARFDRYRAERVVSGLVTFLERAPRCESLRELRIGVADAAREFTLARRAEARAADAVRLRTSRREPVPLEGA